MSDIGLGLRDHLLTKPTIANLVGTRIYPDAPPQNMTLPAIVYYEISGDSEEHLAGAVGLAHTRIQVDAFAATKIEAESVREQVRLACQGYRGAMGFETVAGVSLAGRHANYEPPTDGSDAGRYVRSIDLLISHSEAVPSL